MLIDTFIHIYLYNYLSTATKSMLPHFDQTHFETQMNWAFHRKSPTSTERRSIQTSFNRTPYFSIKHTIAHAFTIHTTQKHIQGAHSRDTLRTKWVFLGSGGAGEHAFTKLNTQARRGQ